MRKRRRKRTRGHQVTFTIPDRPLSAADIRFRVRRHGVKFGDLFISKGALVWFPRSKKRGFKLSWLRFDDLAREHGRRGYGL